MVWRSNISVMGIRTGSSEDVDGGKSDIVLRNFQGGNLTQRPTGIGVKLLEVWDRQPQTQTSGTRIRVAVTRQRIARRLYIPGRGSRGWYGNILLWRGNSSE